MDVVGRVTQGAVTEAWDKKQATQLSAVISHGL